MTEPYRIKVEICAVVDKPYVTVDSIEYIYDSMDKAIERIITNHKEIKFTWVEVSVNGNPVDLGDFINPIERYGTLEHEAWLIEMEKHDD